MKDDQVELNIFAKIKWIGLGRSDEFLGQEGGNKLLPIKIGYFAPGRSKSLPEDPQKQIALLIKGKSSEDFSVFLWQPQAERNPPRWLTQLGQLQQEEKDLDGGA